MIFLSELSELGRRRANENVETVDSNSGCHYRESGIRPRSTPIALPDTNERPDLPGRRKHVAPPTVRRRSGRRNHC